MYARFARNHASADEVSLKDNWGPMATSGFRAFELLGLPSSPSRRIMTPLRTITMIRGTNVHASAFKVQVDD